MKRYRLQRTQHLPVSCEHAWHFFSSPLNLPAITPGWLNLAPIGKVPDRMFPGMVIRYRVTPLFGIPVTWISEITHVDPPHCFVDEQLLGPYRKWHHQHHFRPVCGGVEITDTIAYCLKYGFLGSLLHTLFVRKRLEEIFDFRGKMLKRRFRVRRNAEPCSRSH